MKNNIIKPLAIFLGAVLVLSIVIIIAKKITLPTPEFNSQKNQTQSVKKSPVIIPKGGKIVISFPDVDLIFVSCCGSVLKDVKTEQDNNTMKISGNASFPFSANFQGNLEPLVKNDKLSFQITNLVLGKVEMPQVLSDKIIDLTQKYTDEKINNNFKVKDAKITSKGLEIELK